VALLIEARARSFEIRHQDAAVGGESVLYTLIPLRGRVRARVAPDTATSSRPAPRPAIGDPTGGLASATGADYVE
jgi:hypothetical protein